MITKSLKLKLVAGALGLVLMVSLAITVVVSIIVNRQNHTAVNVNLEKAMTVVRHELNEQQKNMAKEIEQMVAANKIGGTVKFLSEFADDELTITNSSYTTVSTALLNQLNASELQSVCIYDLKGRIQTFAAGDDQNSLRFGFLHQGTVHFSQVQAGAAIHKDEWLQAKDFNGLDIATQFHGGLPTKPLMQFDAIGAHVVMRFRTPLYGLDYDDKGDEVQKMFGTLEAIKLLQEPIVARLTKLTGMSINLFVGDRYSVGTQPANEAIDPKSFPRKKPESWDLATQNISLGDITLEKDRYFQALLPIFGSTEYVGAVGLLQSDAVVRANNRQMITILAVVACGSILLIAPIAVLVTGALVRQISDVATRLRDIAQGDGDLSKRLAVQSADEIGQLATWFNAFIENIHNIIIEIMGNATELDQSSNKLSEIAGLMASNSALASERAEVVSGAGHTMSNNIGEAASAMEKAADKVQMIETSTQEMNATISEISQNAGKARKVTAQAVDQAQGASGQVVELGDAARDIGNVIDAITEISEQVNLLALNATIEAARAGEAGKGFAVVANEIKELARQTAEATNEIKKKVESIQNSTDGTIKEIESISEVVDNVNEIVLVIAGAVEEQSVMTASITENVGQAAGGIRNVNQNVSQCSSVAAEIAKDITDVTESAGAISASSTQVNQSTVKLSELSKKLNRMVGQFKV